MKVTSTPVPVPVPPKEITIVLSERDAETLKLLTNGFVMQPSQITLTDANRTSRLGLFQNDLWNHLNDAGVVVTF